MQISGTSKPAGRLRSLYGPTVTYEEGQIKREKFNTGFPAGIYTSPLLSYFRRLSGEKKSVSPKILILHIHSRLYRPLHRSPYLLSHPTLQSSQRNNFLYIRRQLTNLYTALLALRPFLHGHSTSPHIPLERPSGTARQLLSLQWRCRRSWRRVKAFAIPGGLINLLLRRRGRGGREDFA